MSVPIVDPSDYPPRLFRVERNSSWTSVDRTGLRAKDISTHFTPRHGNLCGDRLAKTLKDHFNWRSGIPSPFISVFSNFIHAINWGRSLKRNLWQDEQVSIIEFNTKVFADLDPPPVVICPRNNDEYLIMHRIHPSAVSNIYHELEDITDLAIKKEQCIVPTFTDIASEDVLDASDSGEDSDSETDLRSKKDVCFSHVGEVDWTQKTKANKAKDLWNLAHLVCYRLEDSDAFWDDHFLHVGRRGGILLGLECKGYLTC